KEDKPSLMDKQKKRFQAKQRNQLYQSIKRIDQDLHPLEEQINLLDRQKKDIEGQLCHQDILQNSEKVQRFMMDLHQINHELDLLLKEWENLMKKKEKIRFASSKE